MVTELAVELVVAVPLDLDVLAELVAIALVAAVVAELGAVARPWRSRALCSRSAQRSC